MSAHLPARALLGAAALGIAMPSWAHPFADRVTAHRLEVTVQAEHLRLDYVVETPVVQAHLGGGALDLQTLDELASGFVVTLDGEPLALTPDPDRPPRTRGGEHTHTTRIGLIATLADSPTGRLEVANGNYPDLPGYFATDVRVGPYVEVVDSSLFEPREGGSPVDRGGSWAPGDGGRRLRLDLRTRDGLLHRTHAHLAGTTEQTRSAWASRSRAPAPSWLVGHHAPWMLLALGAMSLLAAIAPHARDEAPLPRVAWPAALLGAVAWVAIAPTPWAPWLLAVLTLGTLAAAARRHRVAPLLATCAVVIAGQPVAVAALLAGIAAIGRAATRHASAHPAIAPAIATLVGAALLARALGTLAEAL